jgi:hypothetical protein
MQNRHTTSLLRKQQHPTASAAVYDGRTAVGVVVLTKDGSYIARDLRSKIVGRFATLKEAARAAA